MRVTIMLDNNLGKQLRKIQSEMLVQNPASATSFSKVLNLVLKKGLKK